jgi:hypothetical protein
MKLLRTMLTSTAVVSIVVASGCGSVFESIFGDGDDGNNAGASSGTPGLLGGATDGGQGSKPCTNLCLRQKQCPGGGTTSLSGTVKDPAGKVPLYNVLVYVPNAPVAPITHGATCDRCGSVTGDPLVTALTGVDGKFKLENVPVGPDIPLVIQIGKWRRQLVIPNVPECVDTPLADEAIRLPRKKSEGDLPQIALTTGGADIMECWLRKVGIDDSEFTTHTGDGRVHLYAGGTYSASSPATSRFASSHQGGAAFGKAEDFWRSQANLMKYDMVILSCEGTTLMNTKPAEALAAMKAYADAGGRIFASHWHRYWFHTAAKYDEDGTIDEPAGPPTPWEPFATWQDRPDPTNPSYGTINTSFPKGQAMHDWLAQPSVNALCPIQGLCGQREEDKLPIEDPRHNAEATDPARATTWITIPSSGTTAVEYLSANTPIPAPEDQKCGRVVYNALHVTTEDLHRPWPEGCITSDLTPQEKALEFMLFDLSSCIQSDKEPPAPPIAVH